MNLDPSLSLELPSWTEDTSTEGTATGIVNFLEDSNCGKPNGEAPCAADKDLKLRLLSVRYFFRPGDTLITRDPSYADYVAHLEALQPRGIATITDRSSVTVGDRPGTLMSLAVLADAPGVISCALVIDPADDCKPLIAGRAARIAVVDQGWTTRRRSSTCPSTAMHPTVTNGSRSSTPCSRV